MFKMQLLDAVLFGANFVLALAFPFDTVSAVNTVAAAISLAVLPLWLWL